MKKIITGLALGLFSVLATAQTFVVNNLQINGAVTATNSIPLSALVTQASNTVLANMTNSTGEPTAVSIPSCNGSTSALQWTNGAGFSCGSVISPLASNPLNYGAVPNSAAAAVANSSAFASAMAANPTMYCPAGQTFYVQGIVVPTTSTLIYGGCTLIASGTLSPGVGLIEADNNTAGLTIDGLTVTVPIATYPTISGVRLSSSSNFTVRHVTVTAGGYGISVQSGTNYTLDSNNVQSFGNRGIQTIQSTYGSITNNYSNGQNIVGSSHCINVQNSTHQAVTGNHVANCVGFGISINGVPSSAGASSIITVGNNTLSGTHVECINLENVSIASVTGNTCYFLSNHTDFGMSFYGAPGTSPQETVNDVSVTGNTLYNPCKSGIALADVTFRVNVVGNYIYSPNQCNGGTPDYQSAILLYGGNNGPNNVSNNFVVDTFGHMAWQIGEGTYNDGTGTPSGNFLEGMAGTVGTSGQISSSGSGTQVINTSNYWVAFNNPITCSSGTPGSQTVSGLYKQMGKSVQVQFNATLTTVGTCSGNVQVNLPFTAAASGALNGRETTTGNTITGQVSSGSGVVPIFTYNNGSPIGAGMTYILNGTFERQ